VIPTDALTLLACFPEHQISPRLTGRTLPRVTAHPDLLTDPGPCDARRFRARCASQRFACAALSMFLHWARWQHAPRAPSRALYEATLAEDSAPKVGRPRKRAR
jgi:hypothetical protein